MQNRTVLPLTNWYKSGQKKIHIWYCHMVQWFNILYQCCYLRHWARVYFQYYQLVIMNYIQN